MKKQRRTQETDLVPLGEVLASVYTMKQWSRQWRLFHLVRDWPAIVGEQVAVLTAPAFFRGDVLWIHVQDSAWMQHLQYVKIDLLDRINKVLDDQPTTDLRWLQQPIAAPAVARIAPTPQVIDPAQEQMFIELTKSIPNLECRRALLGLWRTFSSCTPK